MIFKFYFFVVDEKFGRRDRHEKEKWNLQTSKTFTCSSQRSQTDIRKISQKREDGGKQKINH